LNRPAQPCVISGFRRKADENRAVVTYYASFIEDGTYRLFRNVGKELLQLSA